MCMVPHKFHARTRNKINTNEQLARAHARVQGCPLPLPHELRKVPSPPLPPPPRNKVSPPLETAHPGNAPTIKEWKFSRGFQVLLVSNVHKILPDFLVDNPSIHHLLLMCAILV